MDCEHLTVELESRPVMGIPQLKYAHWFTCAACHIAACVIETIAVP